MISLDTQNSDKKVTTSGGLVKTKCSKGLTTEQKPLKNPTKGKKTCHCARDTLNL